MGSSSSKSHKQSFIQEQKIEGSPESIRDGNIKKLMDNLKKPFAKLEYMIIKLVKKN